MACDKERKQNRIIFFPDLAPKGLRNLGLHDGAIMPSNPSKCVVFPSHSQYIIMHKWLEEKKTDEN